ncbi:nuclear transcription factor y subunit b-9 [Phtheirospermum japonicum]|uniref:Nuclear transcription factor y subunit b-9 n=1 Tax=Phtheirospermum japonicum TaxID=374723 RepID=A0A830BJI9_9LAMI|nr:nuclear transcription factor y subunit b-9 [Phtheirospermum japonicum]
MPIANVIRIMRRVLPAHAKIADDAKETIQECVSEFISFVTSEANERYDVLSAMASLGFDNYVEPLTAFLEKHRAQDPERGAAHHLAPCARRGVLRPTAQMAPTPAPAPQQPQAMTMGYVPTLPTGPYAVDHHGNYVGLPPQMGGYFMGNKGGGESSSGGAGFDPFAQ